MIDLVTLQKICDDLKGQCEHDLEYYCEVHGVDYDSLELVDHHYIDGEVFECAKCNWWCDIVDLSTREDYIDMVCSDHDDEED